MQEFKGIPISHGYAEGTVYLYGGPHEASPVPRYAVDADRLSEEYERFHEALERSREELRQISGRVLSEIGEAESRIFTAHLALLEDEQFMRNVKERIAANQVNVEHAVSEEIANLSSLLHAVEDEYLRERTEDLRDVGRRLLKHLGVRRSELKTLPAGTVLVAEEFLPSDTLNLDRRQVVAIVTERGGATSHTAILARVLGIPAVTGVTEISRRVQDGMRVLVDGETGRVIVLPTEKTRQRFVCEKASYQKVETEALAAEAEGSRTADGVEVTLLANIGRPEEAYDVARHNLEGIGLFRTEYLFLTASQPPDEESQVRSYRQTAEILRGLPLTVRTLDLGGDKIPSYLPRGIETNPYMGLRGIRFSLSEEALFRTQLRALLKTASTADLQILLPMVSGVEEVKRVKAILAEEAENTGLTRLPRVGAMVETPAAVFEIERILREVDFVSLGTNDLSQFILAADRSAASLLGARSAAHPAVLQAVALVLRAAMAAGKPVSVCGEMAGDPAMAGLLVGLGARQLSMNPSSSPRLRRRIRTLDSREARQRAQEALAAESLAEVGEILRGLETF